MLHICEGQYWIRTPLDLASGTGLVKKNCIHYQPQGLQVEKGARLKAGGRTVWNNGLSL